jgi:hypothetical protein
LTSSIVIDPATRTVRSSTRSTVSSRQVELVLDLADELLEDVLERDDARRAAVLVDHDRQVLPGVAQLAQ